MGGVWERQIRSARGILSSLLKHHGKSLNDESFRTLMVEVESVVNSRPLTVATLSDPTSSLPLTPNQLLTGKTKVVMPPPGIFDATSVYSRKYWRRVSTHNERILDTMAEGIPEQFARKEEVDEKT